MFECKNVISWDELFMGIAELTSQRSKDPSTKVGVCIAQNDNTIMSIGYNGTPKNVDDANFNWNHSDDKDETNILNTKYPYVIHAERNAILNYRGAIRDYSTATLYSTLYPCNECAKEIVTVGIKEIVYKEPPRMEQWIYQASEKLLIDSGVKIRQYK